MQGQSLDMTGKRLYSPGTIAVYLVLSGLPLGLLLYGLNIRRRGQTVMGTILCSLSAMALAALLFLVAAGQHVGSFGIAAVFVAIAIMSVESSPYRAALERGATRAKWWPPAIGLIGIVVLFVIIVAVFGKGNVPR